MLPAPLAERVIALADEAATEAFGTRFAHALDAARTELARAHAFDGLQIQLVGDLGADEGRHFDLYRFNDPAEWSDAGFREYFNSSAICLVEWPQQAGTLLGVPDLVFSLDVDGDGRVLTVRAYSASGKACLERC